MFCGSGGSKGRLAKAKIARPCGATRVLKPKYYNTSAKLRWKCAALWREVDMSKSGRCCAPKQKFEKHLSVGALLEVEMLKKCTPLWREADIEVKMPKARHVRATFGG